MYTEKKSNFNIDGTQRSILICRSSYVLRSIRQ